MGGELKGIKRTNSLPNYHYSGKALAEANSQPQSVLGKITGARGSSGSPEIEAPKAHRLANLADRAQRNIGLDVIEEGHEDETMKADRGLYKPKPSSREAQIKRKNQQIAQNAAIAKPSPVNNYHSAANSNESHSA